MKKRYVIAVCVLLLSALIAIPVLALDIHAVLSRDISLITLSPLTGWAAVMQIRQVRKMYLLLLATVALGLIWVLVSGSSLKYRSDMQQITPDIVTPCADGQGQYGTAKWMPKSKYRTYFTVRRIKNMNIDDLLEAGRQDKEALNAKNKNRI